MTLPIGARNRIRFAGGDSPNALTFAYFADSFTRADQPFLMGNFYAMTPNPSAVGYSSNQIAAIVNVTGNELVFSNAAIGAGAPNHQFTPFVIAPLWGENQFAQIRITSGTAAVDQSSLGVFVFGNPNAGDFYSLLVYNNNAACQWRLSRLSAGVFTHLHGPIAAAFGDTFRLELTRAAGVNTLTVKVNGIQVHQTTDNAFSAGIPGIYGNCTLGQNMHATLFKCGTLPQMRTEDDYSQTI